MHHDDELGDTIQQQAAGLGLGAELRAGAEACASLGLGASGDFPQGRLTETDEGELRLAVGHKDGKVIIHMGTPVSWFGMDAYQATALANSLHEHAAIIRDQELR